MLHEGVDSALRRGSQARSLTTLTRKITASETISGGLAIPASSLRGTIPAWKQPEYDVKAILQGNTYLEQLRSLGG